MTLLLHSCCAPCSTYPMILLKEKFKISLFFYNPNIHPESEYLTRRNELVKLSKKWDFNLILGPYDIQPWIQAVNGHENDLEGGERCRICYRFRLFKTGELAIEKGFDCFGTTLSISPHKNSIIINTIGLDISKQLDIPYYKADFKKKDGFKISCELSRKEGLLRQKYCGCKYSRISPL